MFLKSGIKSLSDEALVEHYRLKNDNRYLGQLFERHTRFVFLICMKYLHNEEHAKDMTMQIFEKLMEDVFRFEIKNFKSWLHVVTRNSCLMSLRTANLQNNPSWIEKKECLDRMENIPDVHHDENNLFEVRLDQLETAMSTLSAEQKRCVELFYLGNKSYADVTVITGFSLNEVKSHIQNGKRNLKHYLTTHGEVLLIFFLSLYFRL